MLRNSWGIKAWNESRIFEILVFHIERTITRAGQSMAYMKTVSRGQFGALPKRLMQLVMGKDQLLARMIRLVDEMNDVEQELLDCPHRRRFFTSLNVTCHTWPDIPSSPTIVDVMNST